MLGLVDIEWPEQGNEAIFAAALGNGGII